MGVGQSGGDTVESEAAAAGAAAATEEKGRVEYRVSTVAFGLSSNRDMHYLSVVFREMYGALYR